MKLKILMFAAALTLATNLSAQTFTVLHSFSTNSYDGANPYASVILSGNTLYGTTYDGGSVGNGTVFKINVDGSDFMILHSFTKALIFNPYCCIWFTNADGINPYGGLTLAGNTLYGTTTGGGISGNGTVFSINTDGSEFTTVHSFTMPSNGTNSDGTWQSAGVPVSGTVLVLSGHTLYGTVSGGGSSGNGTVFRINTDGSDFTNLHSFTAKKNSYVYNFYFGYTYTNSDGANPCAGLTVSGNNLYGTAYRGGMNGAGTIFKLNTDGSGFTVLRQLSSMYFVVDNPYNTDGAWPHAGLVLSNSTLYGITEQGGADAIGAVFSINTNGSDFTNLYSLGSDLGDDGAFPDAGLFLCGNTLYGTTRYNGPSSGGTAFSLNTDGTGFRNLHSFAANEAPYAGLTLSSNILYGMTDGGGSSGYGTVFALSLTPSAPIITTQPQSQAAQVGSNVAFSVVASGLPSPNYQWQFNGQNLANATNATLTLNSVTAANSGSYSVVVSNPYGSVTSSLASLYIQGDPANWNPSFVSVTPQSAPADGQSHVTATVTLMDKNYNPLIGKTVIFYAQGSTDPIPLPSHPTDNNGQTTTTITAITPGKVSIGAIDVSDSFPVPNVASVQFTTGSVVPGADLTSAIAQLANSSSNILKNSLTSDAITEGEDGDYFQATISSDERDNGVTALFTGIGSLITILGPEDDLIKETAMQVASDEGISLSLDIDSIGTSAWLDTIANSDTGLTTYAQIIANNNNDFQQSEFQSEQQLLKGVPPSAQSLSATYTSDIALRIQANEDLDTMALAEKNLILNLQLQSEQAHIDLLSWMFMPVNMVSALAQVSIPVVGKGASIALGLAEDLDTYAVNQQNLSFGVNAANTTETAMFTCSHYSFLIDGNTKSAFSKIAAGIPPKPITGTISSVNSIRSYVPASGWLGVAGTLAGWFNGVTYVTTTGANSEIIIQNNNQQTATFGVSAVYWVTTAIKNQLGDDLVPISVPYLASTSVTIPGNQSAQATLNYFANGKEAAPDVNQPITIYLLGYDNNNGIYGVDSATSYAQWQLDSGATSAIKAKPLGGYSPNGGPTPTNLFAMEYPINCYVLPNPSNQTYQAHILVANPFAIPLQAVVTQPLPPGISVLSTTGLLSGASIIWMNTVVTNGLVDDTFTFGLSVLPGMQTNLPAPTLVFSDSTGTNSWTIQEAAPTFTGLFPIQVAGFIPPGAFGVDTPMQITVTNLVASAESGYLTVSVTDLNGNSVTNLSVTFSVNGAAGTNLNFTLPGNMPVGQYFVTGTLNMNGGAGQVLSGVYVVPPIPFMLHPGAPGFPTTNGMNLSLQGPIGSNYLIEASADLVNWTPLIYFTSTNSPCYFTDTTTTNSSARFYRAVIISVSEIPPLLQAQISGSNIILSWPALATGYGLETSTNLADANSWTAVANVPAVVNGQDVVTNGISDRMRFYRLQK